MVFTPNNPYGYEKYWRNQDSSSIGPKLKDRIKLIN
jgi:hypothetical protein